MHTCGVHNVIDAIFQHLGPELVVEGLASVGVMCVTQQISRLSKKYTWIQ